MKKSPEMTHLEERLRSQKFGVGGFLGEDTRSVDEIIEADAAVMFRLGRTPAQIAQRMHEIMDLAKAGLGTPVRIDVHLEAFVTEVRGVVPCPWPHAGRYDKTVATVRRTDTGMSIRWSALNIHLLEAHGFLEGRGAPFRLDPAELVRIIF